MHVKNQEASSILTLYSPRGGEFSPPLEKTWFSKADFSDLLKENLKTDSTSEWPQILAIYYNTKVNFLRPFLMIYRHFPKSAKNG